MKSVAKLWAKVSKKSIDLKNVPFLLIKFLEIT